MAGRKPTNPPLFVRGFTKRDRVRCPDCEDRGALRNDGGAKVVGGGQLRGSTKDVGVTTAASGCDGCKGKGWITPTDREALDPYSLPLTDVQAARLGGLIK